ncbi:MAG: DUF1549 domain-containing protein [Verrucomicrobiota bacterium]
MKNTIQKIFTICALTTAALALTGTDTSAASKQVLADAKKVDALVQKNLAANDAKPYPMTDDATFVRRIYLDLAGRIPTAEESQAFLKSKDPAKRTKLIDQLLDSDGYLAHHFNYWSDILRVKTLLSGAGQSRPAGYAYMRWIKDSIRDNKPYDQFVREMLTADGVAWENGAVGYYIRDYGMNLCNMSTTTQVFLGTSVQCAQCHDHPFDKWTQMDFYKAAAFQYNLITTNGSENQNAALAVLQKNNKEAYDRDGRDLRRAFSEILKPLRFNNVKHTNRNLTLPHDYQYDDAKPKSKVETGTLFGHEAEVKEGENPLFAYAEWMTSKENPRFTTVITNRMWKKAMGLALIEPLDEITDASKPTNPELMAFLENRMRAYNYDLKKFMAMVHNTKTYQRQAHRKDVMPGEQYHYPGPLLRRMSAEQIWDSIVTLVIDDPDAANPYTDLNQDKLLTRTKWIAEAVYDQSPQEFLKSAKQVAATQKKLSDEMRELAEKRAEALEKEDVALARKLAAESGKKQRELVKMIESNVYEKGFDEKLQLVAANLKKDPKSKSQIDDELVADLTGCIEDGTMSLADLKNSPMMDIVNTVMKEKDAELKAWNEDRKKREWKDWGIKSADQQKAWYSYNSNRQSNMTRSVNLTQPAPRGHFLREFGQSDREVVENANDEATISQALNLLNNPGVHSSLRNPYSKIRRDLKDAASPEEALDALYLALYSRKPTDQESKLLLPIIAENQSQGALEVAWTMLNTTQFLFIQ